MIDIECGHYILDYDEVIILFIFKTYYDIIMYTKQEENYQEITNE